MTKIGSLQFMGAFWAQKLERELSAPGWDECELERVDRFALALGSLLEMRFTDRVTAFSFVGKLLVEQRIIYGPSLSEPLLEHLKTCSLSDMESVIINVALIYGGIDKYTSGIYLAKVKETSATYESHFSD